MNFGICRMEYPGIPNFEWLRIVLNRVLKAGYSLLDSTLTLSCMNFCSLTFLETYVLGKKKTGFIYSVNSILSMVFQLFMCMNELNLQWNISYVLPCLSLCLLMSDIHGICLEMHIQ